MSDNNNAWDADRSSHPAAGRWRTFALPRPRLRTMRCAGVRQIRRYVVQRKSRGRVRPQSRTPECKHARQGRDPSLVIVANGRSQRLVVLGQKELPHPHQFLRYIGVHLTLEQTQLI